LHLPFEQITCDFTDFTDFTGLAGTSSF